MSHQKVKDVMSTDVATALEVTSFKDVARILASWDVSALPVVDRDRRVLGVVSAADLLVKQGKQEFGQSRALLSRWRERRDRRRATATTAAQLMTRPAITVDADSTVAAAARLLTRHHVKRLLVVNEDGKLVGIVSRKDLLTVFLRKDKDIRAAIVEQVFERGLGIAVTPDTVTVEVHDGGVVLTGELDLKSQVSLVTDMTKHVDGVVDVTVSVTYRHDNTRGHFPDPMTVDITHPPRVG